MQIFNETISVETQKGIHLHDITAEVNEVLQSSKINNGFLVINSMHTTTALIINEFESRLMDDVRQFLHEMISPGKRYLHNDIHLRDCPDDEPENAHSHIAAMMLSTTESIIVNNAELQLGKWQSIILAELDGPRKRNISIQVMGEQ